jgi:CubicO group peptidase (beta-lactamase class C family)
MHQPGERWLYHSSFDILGVLVARAAGQPFEDFLAERIFVPLGMQDTAFAVPEAKRPRLAASHQADAPHPAGSRRATTALPCSHPAARGCSPRSRTIWRSAACY